MPAAAVILPRNNWRASLVPAAAVIPASASTAYKKVDAVYLKKLLFKMDSLNNSLSLMVFRWSNPALIRLKKCLDPLVTCPSFLIPNETGA